MAWSLSSGSPLGDSLPKGSPAASLDPRYLPTAEAVTKTVKAWREAGFVIVLAMGTFDMLHIGHLWYLEQARSCGDVLLVGVDGDEKVRLRKGPRRPILPEDERVQMLMHVRHVDAVTIKPHTAPRWDLVRRVRPDILVASKPTYTKQELEQLTEYCTRVTLLPVHFMSTTQRLQRIQAALEAGELP